MTTPAEPLAAALVAPVPGPEAEPVEGIVNWVEELRKRVPR